MDIQNKLLGWIVIFLESDGQREYLIKKSDF